MQRSSYIAKIVGKEEHSPITMESLCLCAVRFFFFKCCMQFELEMNKSVPSTLKRLKVKKIIDIIFINTMKNLKIAGVEVLRIEKTVMTSLASLIDYEILSSMKRTVWH